MISYTPQDLEIKDLHQLIVGAVAPRPIAFVSTVDAQGLDNIAPYSFFNAFSSNPPIFVFSSNRRVRGNTTKDTLHNIEQTREAVINVVNYDMVRQMALASVSYPAGVSEFEQAGLTAVDSVQVKPKRLAEAPVQFECKVKDIITLGLHGGAGHLIICEVVQIHIKPEMMDERGRLDPHRLDLVGRLGRAYYVRASGDSIFSLHQDQERIPLGFKSLPDDVLNSSVLRGNDLAQLAGIYDWPDEDFCRQQWAANPAWANLTELELRHEAARLLLAEERVLEAWALLLGPFLGD